MKYPRIVSAIRSARWAITPSALQAITDTLGSALRGELRVASRIRADVQPIEVTVEQDDTQSLSRNVEGVTVIKVYGILGKHLSAMEMDCGGVDVDVIAEEIDKAATDESSFAIVLDFDSPGGVVTGIPELAAKIRAMSKPVFAFTSAQCCSAAYWLAAAARDVYCTPSSDLGSIGVYVAMVDESEWWKKQGFKLELIKAGEFKAMGISGKSLTDEERAMIQADVDAIYAMFAQDVRAGRGAVADAVMQGQTFMGADAVKANLATRIVSDVREVVRLVRSVG